MTNKLINFAPTLSFVLLNYLSIFINSIKFHFTLGKMYENKKSADSQLVCVCVRHSDVYYSRVMLK